MPKNFIISLLIISGTIIGGTCLFGFCVSADSEEFNNIISADRDDIPVSGTVVIKEDGKLNGQILKVNNPKIDFGSSFDLSNNQKKVIKAENNKNVSKVRTAKNKKIVNKSDDQKISIEVASVLKELKKQEQEVRSLVAELKNLKNNNKIPDNKEINNITSNKDNITQKVMESNQNTKMELAQIKKEDVEEAISKKNNNIKLVSKSEKRKKKYEPMIVESVKKSQQKEQYASIFKDYSFDNSGRTNNKNDIQDNNINGGFEKAFSSLRPEKTKPQNILAERRKKSEQFEKISGESVQNFHNAYVNIDNVKKDFYKTYITENKYLKPFETDEEDENKNKKADKRGHDILQLKIEFQENSASLSAVDVNILRYFVYIAQNDPTKGVQISISQDNMKDINKKKLAARRLAIVSAIFKEEGLSDSQIIPILTDRDTESFIFSIISIDKMENYRKGNEGKDMFGDTIGTSQTFKTMKW